MKKNVSYNISKEILEKFEIALTISKENASDTIEKCMCSYISKVFGDVSKDFNPNYIKKPNEKSYYMKALHRIPIWAVKPNQNNHKIICAYFKTQKKYGNVTLSTLEKMCSDKEQLDVYVPTFKINFYNMKIDGEKSHGKVFEDDGNNVWIWSEIEPTLMKYKDYFYNDNSNTKNL